MRRDEDPLEGYLFRTRHVHDDFRPEYWSHYHKDLQSLAAFLDRPPTERGSPDNINIWAEATTVGLDPADLSLAEELYRRVYQTGGPGSHLFQESLLHMIAATADPVSLPFWLEILAYARPRDQFANRRRQISLAALAFLAIQHNDPAAYAALHQASDHENPAVRALAVYYLGQAYLEAERPLPADVLEVLAAHAVNDPSFGPRFMARSLLRATGQPVPLDNPGGLYAFKARLRGYRPFSCTIELRSEQTLDDLHYAIQKAFQWDDDHLYSFFMNGQHFDPQYSFASPEEDDRPPWTDEAVIGELGLVIGHKFVYYFDYGDGHEFEIEVVDIRSQAEPGQYPRVIESQGKPPEQYGW